MFFGIVWNPVQILKNVSHQSPYQRIKLMLWLILATKDMMGLPKAWNNQRWSSVIIQAVMPHTLRKVRSRNIWRLKGNRKNKWKDPKENTLEAGKEKYIPWFVRDCLKSCSKLQKSLVLVIVRLWVQLTINLTSGNEGAS